MKTRKVISILVLVVIVSIDDSAAAPKFEESAVKSGVVYSHERAVFDAKAEKIMPWLTAGGAGIAVGDYDNDGLDDIYAVTSRGGAPNALFRNKGNFEFEEVAETVGLAEVNGEETGTSAHALWFDYDGDGWRDLLLLRFGYVSLYRNIEGKSFEETTEESGLSRLMNSLSAVAFDYDRDGDLDLYIGGYFPEKDFNDLPDTKVLFDSWETARNGGPNYMFTNNGDGTFVENTEETNTGDTGWTMAIAHGDLDNDGWGDLYIANDFGTDIILRNKGDGSFEDLSSDAIGVDTKKGMNADLGDYNNDGRLDIYVTNMTEPYLHECNMLWENMGDFVFSDVSSETNSCDTGWGWGAKFFDADNDGLQDLYVANGFISDGEEDYMTLLLDFIFEEDIDLRDAEEWPDMKGYSMAGYEKNVFLHQQYGLFTELHSEAGADHEGDSRGVSIADFDKDGRMDMVVSNVAGPMRLYRNITEEAGNWVGFQLRRSGMNGFAVGARVVVEAGGEQYLREVNNGNGFNSTSSLDLHFGVGDADTLDKITVTWPDGTVESVEPPELNAWYRIVEGENTTSQLSSSSQETESTQNDEPATFAEISEAAGIDQPHQTPQFDEKLGHIMEMVAAGAAGAAIGDYDGDGDLDVFVNNARNNTPNYLWRNDGDDVFTDVAHKSNALADSNTEDSVSAGGLFFDYDGDGNKDLFVYHLGTSRLYRNAGDDTFDDVTEKSGLAEIYRNTLSAIAFDPDKDGDIDLYLGSYFPDVNMFKLENDRAMHDSWETASNGGSNVFLENNGDGTFTEETAKFGLMDSGWTMAIGHGDIDNDGWQDVYIANDYGADKLLKNENGVFVDVSKERIGIDTKKGMNAEFADFDGDGNLDIYVTNVTEEFLHECNMLWRNDGTGSFVDISNEMNVCDGGWAWGAKFFDYDNDSDLDLYVANGFFTAGDNGGDYLDVLLPALWNDDEDPSSASKWPPLNGMSIASREKNVFFINEGNITFTRNEDSPLAIESDSRGVFTADFDNDGRVDVLVTNNGEPPSLFKNQVENDNNWITLNLIGQAPNTDAVGSRVTVETDSGTQIREVNIGNGFAGNSSTRQHFGIGRDARVKRITISWASGGNTTIELPPINTVIDVTEDQPIRFSEK